MIVDLMKKRWHRYHYKNLTYLLVGFIAAFFLRQSDVFHVFLFRLGEYGYLGSFIGGMLFVSTFTISVGSVILLTLAERLNPLEIGLIAGFGAVIGDFIIFKFIRNKGFVDEVRHFFDFFGGDKISHLIHTKYFSWTLPVIGALIIASPLPDELGVGLMGISRLKTYQFLILSFVLDSIGIFLVVLASTFIKP